MKKTAIIDYGLSNLSNIVRSFTACGIDVDIVSEQNSIEINKYSRLVLPGVGAFSDGMKGLEANGMEKAIKEFIKTGKPMLGVCLGMQLLFEESEESPGVKGLGIIHGSVKCLKGKSNGTVKIPHIGWNTVDLINEGRNDLIIFSNLPEKRYAYFAHSYYVAPQNRHIIQATTEHGGFHFCSMIVQDNIIGFQFHPEMSDKLGIQLIRNFCLL